MTATDGTEGGPVNYPAIPPRPDLPYFDHPSIGEPRRPRRRRTRGLVAAALVALLVLGGIGINWNLTREGQTVSPATVRPAGTANTNLNMQATAKKVAPAVVDIYTYTHPTTFGGSACSGQTQLTPLGAATGMVLTPSGEVLTNNHVVNGAYSIQVTIPNHTGTYKADVVGVDPTSDVALIQIEGVSGLPTVSTADASSLSVGQNVIAIGNALGKGGPPAVTGGVIAALNQSITASDAGNPRGAEHLTGLIQTDAEIRPGDSGGPLVDTTGHVIGMITAGSANNDSSGVPSTVGFAITTNAALDIVNQIRAGNASQTIFLGQVGFLGVAVGSVDAATASRLGLSTSSGALVQCVVPAGPAATAGITSNSVITTIDGIKISSLTDLGQALHVHGVGEQVRVTWINKTGTHTSLVTLTSGHAV